MVAGGLILLDDEAALEVAVDVVVVVVPLVRLDVPVVCV